MNFEQYFFRKLHRNERREKILQFIFENGAFQNISNDLDFLTMDQIQCETGENFDAILNSLQYFDDLDIIIHKTGIIFAIGDNFVKVLAKKKKKLNCKK